MVNWQHGRIKEIARIFHEKFGLCNITYETSLSSVVFFCDGYFLALYEYPDKKVNWEDIQPLINEIRGHK